MIGNTTPVGSYAANFYGTFDMGGNLREWNESIIDGAGRGVRGGQFDTFPNNLRATTRGLVTPFFEDRTYGFRVSQLPTPGAAALLGLEHFL